MPSLGAARAARVSPAPRPRACARAWPVPRPASPRGRPRLAAGPASGPATRRPPHPVPVRVLHTSNGSFRGWIRQGRGDPPASSGHFIPAHACAGTTPWSRPRCGSVPRPENGVLRYHLPAAARRPAKVGAEQQTSLLTRRGGSAKAAIRRIHPGVSVARDKLRTGGRHPAVRQAPNVPICCSGRTRRDPRDGPACEPGPGIRRARRRSLEQQRARPKSGAWSQKKPSGFGL